MKSRLSPAVLLVFVLLCLLGLFVEGKERLARYNYWVSQDKADSTYLNEVVTTIQQPDGRKVGITRKHLLDFLILKNIEELKQKQALEHGR